MCKAFDVVPNAVDAFDCHLAGETYQVMNVSVNDNDTTVHFKIELFPGKLYRKCKGGGDRIRLPKLIFRQNLP